MSQNIVPQPNRIKRLKAERIKQGLTYQDIVDRTLEAQEYVSINTVYRIFKKGSEEVGFRDSTLRHIEKALGIDDSAEPSLEPKPELLERIIKEMNLQLKASRRAHAWKNAAIAFLTVLLAALLAVDRVLPEVGWYGTAGTAAWWIIAALLAAFVVAVAAYHTYLRVHVKAQEKAEAEQEF